MSTASDNIHQIRKTLGAPSRAVLAWDERMTREEKRFLLKAAGLDEGRHINRWCSLTEVERQRIGRAVRRWIDWAQQFAGCFV